MRLRRNLGLELEEVEGWNCCGASSAHSLDHTSSLALPAKILAQAEAQKMEELVVPCAACFNRLASTRTELAANASARTTIADIIGMPYAGTTAVRNILDPAQPGTHAGSGQIIPENIFS